jgi:hypothetical protein
MADDKTSAWLGFFGAIVVALIGAAATIWVSRGPPNPPPREPIEDGSGGVKPVVMGQLQYGVNLQGMDFDAFGKHAENEQLCAEMCRTTETCKAMTYVISMKTCWLKSGVPPPFPPGGKDYVSSSKQ